MGWAKLRTNLSTFLTFLQNTFFSVHINLRKYMMKICYVALPWIFGKEF